MEWRFEKGEALADVANKFGVVFGVWKLESRFTPGVGHGGYHSLQWRASPVLSGMLLKSHPTRRGCAGPVLMGGMRTGRRLHGTEPPRINWNVREAEPPVPPSRVFLHGKPVAVIQQGEGRTWHIQALIFEVAKRSNTIEKTDWDYVGGRAVVRTLGRVAKVQEVLRSLWPQYSEMFKNSQIQIQEAP